MSKEQDVKVGLLIGANCPLALEPHHVVPSQNGGPFAFKTTLGWCVVGPMHQKHHSSSFSCNRIAVTNAGSEKVATHQFVIEEQFKETNIENMLK